MTMLFCATPPPKLRLLRRALTAAIVLLSLTLVALTSGAGSAGARQQGGHPGEANDLLVSTDRDRNGAVSLHGATIGGDVYVFTGRTRQVAEVAYHVDDPARRSEPTTVERSAPFDLAGSDGSGSPRAFDASELGAGEHVITAVLELQNGREQVLEATFTVGEAAATPASSDPAPPESSADEPSVEDPPMQEPDLVEPAHEDGAEDTSPTDTTATDAPPSDSASAGADDVETVTAGDRGALLSRREGFGRNAGQGAESFSEVTVTNLNDSGSGSLRDALSTGSRWITFEPGLSGTIDLGSTLDVPSDVVIDGRGADITLAADSSTVILSLYRADNIIVTNLKLDGGYDGIQIYQGTTNVWIDHITATAAADEVIGITGETERPDLITVSWSRFDNAGKVMLLSGSEYDINHSSDRVTLHHNLYNRSFDRHPLVRFSRVHAYNNWLYQWGREGTGQGIRVGNQGQFRSEANIYDDVHGRPALIPEDMGTYGNAISIGDVTTGDPEIQERNPDQVFDPADHYSYSLDTPGDALRAELSANAGWQPTN